MYHELHTELIAHFLCGGCKNWWSISEYPMGHTITCPHCGTFGEVSPQGTLMDRPPHNETGGLA